MGCEIIELLSGKKNLKRLRQENQGAVFGIILKFLAYMKNPDFQSLSENDIVLFEEKFQEEAKKLFKDFDITPGVPLNFIDDPVTIEILKIFEENPGVNQAVLYQLRAFSKRRLAN